MHTNKFNSPTLRRIGFHISARLTTEHRSNRSILNRPHVFVQLLYYKEQRSEYKDFMDPNSCIVERKSKFSVKYYGVKITLEFLGTHLCRKPGLFAPRDCSARVSTFP